MDRWVDKYISDHAHMTKWMNGWMDRRLDRYVLARMAGMSSL